MWAAPWPHSQVGSGSKPQAEHEFAQTQIMKETRRDNVANGKGGVETGWCKDMT